MARRKNVKRIDPRYFLHETVDHDEELEEGCPHAEEGDEAIDISAPGMEVHVDDISQLSPEEAFGAGMAAARDAIDQAMGPDPEDEVPLEEARRGKPLKGHPDHPMRHTPYLDTPYLDHKLDAASPHLVRGMTDSIELIQSSVDAINESLARASKPVRAIPSNIDAGVDIWTELRKINNSVENIQTTLNDLAEMVPVSRFEE